MRVITYNALIRPILCVFRDFFNAAVHGIYSLGEDVAVGWNSLRFVAFSRLHGLPVFHLYGLLYHCWSVLLHSPSSSLPHVENRTKGMQPFYCVFTYLLCSLFCNSVNSDLPKCEKKSAKCESYWGNQVCPYVTMRANWPSWLKSRPEVETK